MEPVELVQNAMSLQGFSGDFKCMHRGAEGGSGDSDNASSMCLKRLNGLFGIGVE